MGQARRPEEFFGLLQTFVPLSLRAISTDVVRTACFLFLSTAGLSRNIKSYKVQNIRNPIFSMVTKPLFSVLEYNFEVL